MDAETINELKKQEEIMNELCCPNCGGYQVEESMTHYIQFRCTNCGLVESYQSKSDRAWLKMGVSMKVLDIFGLRG